MGTNGNEDNIYGHNEYLPSYPFDFSPAFESDRVVIGLFSDSTPFVLDVRGLGGFYSGWLIPSRVFREECRR